MWILSRRETNKLGVMEMKYFGRVKNIAINALKGGCLSFTKDELRITSIKDLRGQNSWDVKKRKTKSDVEPKRWWK